MKHLTLLALLLGLGGCANSALYSLEAYNNQGRLVGRAHEMRANEAGIATAQKSLCRLHPHAVIVTTNTVTRTEARAYSPYSCR